MFSGNSFSGDDTEEQKVCVLVLVRFGSFPGCPKDGYLIAVALFYTRSSFTFFDKYAELQLWMLHWYSLVVGIGFDTHSLAVYATDFVYNSQATRCYFPRFCTVYPFLSKQKTLRVVNRQFTCFC